MKFLRLLWLFPALFCVEMALGLNGYQFTLFGISIRIILFCLSAVSLVGLCLLQMKRKKLSLLPKSSGSIWNYWRGIDWFVFGFLALNLLWATLIPMLVRGNTHYALQDFRTLLTLVLYFPCALLLRMGEFPWRKAKGLIYVSTVLLGLWHSVMFIGETLKPGFYLAFFDLMDVISFGSAVRDDLIMGFGLVRIIQTTSVLLIPGLFLAADYARHKKWPAASGGVVILFALLVTYTKSIWFGVLAGLFLVLLGLVLSFDSRQKKRLLAFLGATVVLTIIANACLGGTIFTRAANGLISNQQELLNRYEQLSKPPVSTDPSSPSDPTEPTGSDDSSAGQEDLIKDLLGTYQANQLRSQQAKALLAKWKLSPVVGHGYGAYAEDLAQREGTPFMYEYTLPALAMKLGAAGLLNWLVFVCALIFVAVKRFWKQDLPAFLLWLAAAASFALAVQTNPFLFTFPGMFVLLLLALTPQCPASPSSEEAPV